MSVNPISGNQNYTKINDTVVTPSAVFDALLKSHGPIGIKTIIGTVSAFAGTGAVPYDYMVKDLNGNNIQFQAGDMLLSSTMMGNGTLVSPTDAVTLTLQLQEFAGDAPGSTTPIGNAIITDTPLANRGQTTVTSFVVPDDERFLSVVLSAEDITAGILDVRVNLIPLQL